MGKPPEVTAPNLWIGGLVLAAVVVGIFALMGIDRSGEEGSGLSDAFDYQIESYKNIDPALIRYDRVHEIATGLKEARAVAIGPEDGIYVAGDQAIRVFEPDGTLRQEIALDAPPRCLAVAGAEHVHPGRIYVGMQRHVEVLDERGKPAASWESLGEQALLTSLAVAEQDVFAADAGNRLVMRYDPSGQLVGRIEARGSGDQARGFVIRSPFFDVAAGQGELLHVANPGALRIETYSFDGDLEAFWGQPTPAVEGFFGCCNPAHFALLPDGRFVTAEKGLVRVKVYTADGQFDCVVAGPKELDLPKRAANGSLWDQEFKAVDVAADSSGRVLVLDLASGTVQIYQSKQTEPEQNDG